MPRKKKIVTTEHVAAEKVKLINQLEEIYKEYPELQAILFSKIYPDAMIFVLDSDQVNKFNKWYNKLKKRPSGAIGGGLTFSFTPTGLGEIARVKYFDEELDLSDYESW